METICENIELLLIKEQLEEKYESENIEFDIKEYCNENNLEIK